MGVLVLSLLPVTRFTPSSSAAEPPAAASGYAVVGIYVGGDRTSPTSVGPLGGVTFGFFTGSTRPTAFDATTGFATGTPAQTCTSTADGWCNLRVPIGTGSGEVAAGTRYWVAPISAPAGWYANEYFQTGPLTRGTGNAAFLQTPYIFQTPALQSNGRYVSTDSNSNFMDDPGDSVTDTQMMADNGTSAPSGASNATINAGNYYQRRAASSGIYMLSHANPALPNRCGLNVALVVDLSASVMTPTNYLPQLKSAMNEFVNALQGTPSQVSLTTFGTTSPAAGYAGSNTGLMPVASTADATAFKNIYAGWGTNTTNYTNWDAGLDRVATLDEDQHIDVAVMITDGNPTVYGASGATANGSGFTRFRELENSVASANAIKAQGTRVLAVGVGAGLDAGAARNLRAISGTTAYNGTDISSADYLQESSYGNAGDALHNLAVGACAPSISVIKQIIPSGGTLADAYTPASPWEFTATGAAGTFAPPHENDTSVTQSTDPSTGSTNFDLQVDPGPNRYGLAENLSAHPDYSLVPVTSDGSAIAGTGGGQNAFCVDKTHDDAPLAVTNTGPDSFSVEIHQDTAASCTVYNQAPPFDSATVAVHKTWSITSGGHTATYPEGDQPPGLESALSLTGPGTAGASGQSWDVPREGYQQRDPTNGVPGEPVTISEDVTLQMPGCRLTGASIDGTGLTAPQDLSATAPTYTHPEITQRTNEWTITNAVTCDTGLTLAKEVHPRDSADVTSWTLHADAPSGALPGPSGTSGSAAATADVTPGRAYTLSETPADDPELLNFVHTGTDCVLNDSGEGEVGNPVENSSVVVPLGQHMTCTFANTAVPLTVIKHVDGGTASPGDFEFHVDPVAPFPAGLPSRTFAGEASPGHHLLVRPGQTYRITETGGPAGYEMSSLVCGVRSARAAPDEFTMPANGSPVICTATNTYSTWTAEKSADPPPGQVQPGQVITYTLTARHLDGAPTQDVYLSDDLTQVLEHATFVHGSINASAGTASLQGNVVVWTVPELGGTETVSFQVRVNDDAWGATLTNQLGDHFTGTPEDPADPAVDCEQVTGRPDCDETVHHVSPEPSANGGGTNHAGGGSGGSSNGGGLLPDTGGPELWLLIGAALTIAVGGTFVAAGRSRRRI